LGREIQEALLASRYLIVICSPNAARSQWVNKEISTFQRFKRHNRILALIVDGLPNAGDDRECFPEALRTTEPLAADARSEADGKTNAKLKLLAGMLGIRFDSLRQRDSHRRIRRLSYFAVLATVLLTVMGFLSVYAFYQKAMADSRQREAMVQKQQAVSARQKETIARKNAEENLYASQISIAWEKWRDNDVSNAEQVLSQCVPELRNWEWGYLKRICHLDLMTFAGHKTPVWGVAYSEDGKRVAAIGADLLVKVWDLNSMSEIAAFGAPRKPIYEKDGVVAYAGNAGIAFDPNSGELATGSTDGSIKIWNVDARRQASALAGSKALPRAIAFSPDGKYLGAASDDETVRIWDKASHALEWILPDPSTVSIAFGPGGKRLASLDCHGRVKVWDLTTGKVIAVGQNRIKAVAASSEFLHVALSPDGGRIASGSFFNVVNLTDATNGAELRELYGHEGDVVAVAFSRDGKRIASGGDDRSVRIWNALSGEVILVLRGHAGGVNDVAFSPDGERVISGSADGTVKLWSATAGRECRELRGGKGGLIKGVVFSPDGKWLASAGEDTSVRLWSTQSWQNSITLEGHTQVVQTVAFTPDSGLLVSGSYDGTVKVWNTSAPGQPRTIGRHQDGVYGVAISPDGKRIVSGGGDRTVKLWDAMNGSEVFAMPGHGDDVTSVAFSPDGKRIVSASGDKTLRVWDASTGSGIQTFTGHTGWVCSAAYSPDGGRIASASSDGTVRLWDAATGVNVLTLRGHDGTVRGAAFSPDGKRIVSVGQDATRRIWDALSGREMFVLRTKDAAVQCVAFSPDGRTIATGDWDRALRVWEASQFRAAAGATAAEAN